MKPKAALIVDNLSLCKWQKDVMEEAKKKLDIVLILNCKNTKYKRKIFKNFLYYILNFFSLRNFLSKKSKIKFYDVNIINFNSIYAGIWQSLPEQVINQINKKK